MNKSRNREKKPKPVKKHREGFTGERRKKNKLKAINKRDKKCKEKNSLPQLSKLPNRESESYKNLRESLMNRFKKSNVVSTDSIQDAEKKI